MTRKMRSYEYELYERLRDPEYAAEYLNGVIEESGEDLEARLLVALNDVAKAYGMSKLSKETDLWRKSLYKALSPDGNPRLSTLVAIMQAIGLKLRIDAEKKRATS